MKEEKNIKLKDAELNAVTGGSADCEDPNTVQNDTSVPFQPKDKNNYDWDNIRTDRSRS